MLKLRMARGGKKNYPVYRIVVAEHTQSRDGKFVEKIGYYIPEQKNRKFSISKERLEYWTAKGATPSPTLKTLLKKYQK